MLSAECPSCGAPVLFQHAASAAAVCGSCQSTVIRDGIDELVVWGKVSAFSRDLSPIQVGASGVLGDRPFQVAGVLRRSRPGVRWNEWYIVFDDRTTGWLSEGNGFLQIFGGAHAGAVLPSHASLHLGEAIEIGDDRYIVIERAEAAVVAAEGELPFAVSDGLMRPYADLRRSDGRATGTIDYADSPPEFWPGRIVTLESLKMEGLRAFAGWSDPTLVSMQGPEVQLRRGLDCPNCGGSLPLRAPGTTVQLVCEYCGSELSIEEVGDENTARVLRAHRGQVWKPRLPLGKRGRIDDVEWEIIGAMKRAVRADGIDYPWVEYFLHNPYRGSRFLMEDQRGHWNLADRLGGVPTSQGTSAWARQRLGSEVYRHFSGGKAVVRNVLGELDWEVKVGDSVDTHDYVSPPHMLSREGDRHEVAWSRSTYLSKEAVEDAFGVSVRSPWGVAANQPNPYSKRSIWLAAILSAGSLWVGSLVVLLLGIFLARNETVLDSSYTSTGAVSDVWVSEPFAVDAGFRNHLGVRSSTTMLRSAGQVHVALINQDNGQVYLPLNTTSQNAASGSIYFADPGAYVARVEIARPAPSAAQDKLNVKIVLDPISGFPCFAFFFPFLIPIVLTLARASFESRRWSESDHAG